MGLGGGKYEDVAKRLMQELNVSGIVLIVCDDDPTNAGFTAALPPHWLVRMPDILMDAARSCRLDIAEIVKESPEQRLKEGVMQIVEHAGATKAGVPDNWAKEVTNEDHNRSASSEGRDDHNDG
jgi:hypothetical protein